MTAFGSTSGSVIVLRANVECFTHPFGAIGVFCIKCFIYLFGALCVVYFRMFSNMIMVWVGRIILSRIHSVFSRDAALVYVSAIVNVPPALCYS